MKGEFKFRVQSTEPHSYIPGKEIQKIGSGEAEWGR